MLKEDKNITLTRAIACFMIVLVHVGEQRYYNSEINTMIFELSALAIIIGRVAVPLFFMISGFLLFSKNKYQEFNTKIIKQRFLTIFIPLVYFTVVYFIYAVFMGTNPNSDETVYEYFAEGISHLWYLGYILPVYTLSSFIHIPNFQSNKQLWGLLGMLTFFFFVTESIMSRPYTFNAFYSFNQALLYMFVGYILKQFSFKGKLWATGFISAFILLTYISYLLLLYAKDFTFGGGEYFSQLLNIVQYLLGSQEQILPSYKTLGVFLQAVFLFLFFQSLNLTNLSHKIYYGFSWIAKRSLKIYGWHMLFIFLISDFMSVWNEYLLFFVSFIVAIIGSLLLDYLEKNLKSIIKLHKI